MQIQQGRKRTRPEPTLSPQEAADAALLAKPCPTESEDAAGWLRWHRALWRTQRRRHREQKKAPPSGSGVQDFLARQAAQVKTAAWHVLQVAEGSQPGELRVHFLTEGGAMSVQRVRVPRRFYVEMPPSANLAEVSPEWRKVTLMPPHTIKPRGTVYEVAVEEELFLKHKTHLRHALRLDAHAHLYETQLPLPVRAVLDLGSVWRIKREARGQLHGGVWPIEALEGVEGEAATKYLHQVAPRLLFLWQSHANDEKGRATLGLYAPDQRKSALLFAAPFTQEPLQGVQAAVRKAAGEAASDLECSVQRHPDLATAGRALSTLLAEHKRLHPGPTLIAVQCALPPSELRALVASLDEFPQIQFPANERDGAYPPFAWFAHQASLFVQYALNSPPYLDQCVELARFARVPVCNVGIDYPVTLVDLLMGRALHQRNQLLWWGNPAPDLGGAESDALPMDAPSQPLLQDTPMAHAGGRTLDVELSGLLANALMEAPHLASLEGADTALFADLNDADPRDESIACASAFRVLRDLVLDWAAAHHGSTTAALTAEDPTAPPKTQRPPNRLAGIFLRALPRWLNATEAQLYDPALVRLVGTLERKVWQALLGEVRRLGGKIIHASATRLLLATDKPTATEAAHYAAFLHKTLTKKRALFRHIGWNTRAIYSAALWRDTFNWVAVPDDGEHSPVYRMNLVQFIAPSLRELFSIVVLDFLAQLAQLPPPTVGSDDAAAGNEPQQDRRGTSGYSLIKEWSDARRDALTEPQRHLLQHVTNQLLEATQDAKRRSADAPTEHTPDGLRALLGDPAEALSHSLPSSPFSPSRGAPLPCCPSS